MTDYLRERFLVKRFLALVLGAAFVASATPALAVVPTLPAGNVLFQVTCDSADANDRQLMIADIVGGSNSLLGDGTGANTLGDCGLQGALAPGTDWFYYNDGTNRDTLVRVNVVTGDVEEIGAIREDSSPRDIYGIAIGPDGIAYALSYDYLYTIDLLTGELTYLNEPDVYGQNEGYPYGFAYDPKTRKFYVAEDGDGEIFSLDVSTGLLTSVNINGDFWIGSMVFDSAGYLWFNGDDFKLRRATLRTFNDNATILETADLYVGGTSVYSESLGIVRPPVTEDESEALAPTGSSDVTGFAALAGLVGLAAVWMRRRAAR